jgi:hypothetical protein
MGINNKPECKVRGLAFRHLGVKHSNFKRRKRRRRTPDLGPGVNECPFIQGPSFKFHTGCNAEFSFTWQCAKMMNHTNITFFKRGPADPSQQCKRASNSIQDPQPRWILTCYVQYYRRK